MVCLNKKHRNVQLISEESYVTKTFFSDGKTLEVSRRDLLIASDGYRSILCATTNPNMEWQVSLVNKIVFSIYAPELAWRIDNTFHKTVCWSTGLGYGLLASTSSQVIGFIQSDTSKHEIRRTEQET